MELPPVVFEGAAILIYGAQALLALAGMSLVILQFNQIARLRFSRHTQYRAFMDQVRAALQARQPKQVAALCDVQPYASKAVPQLILHVLAHADREPARLRRLLAEQFERDVLTSLESGLIWISTLAKSGPLLGLLGTVIGMMSAFARLGPLAGDSGTEAAQLTGDIRFALLATASGLLIAIPLTLAAAALQVRISRLQDDVQQGLSEFLDEWEAANRPHP